MAATAGALGPLVIGGMGIGIWKFVTRTRDTDKSDDLWPPHRGETPDYGSRRGNENSLSNVCLFETLHFCGFGFLLNSYA